MDIDYIVLMTEGVDELELRVLEKLKQGYLPQGGIAISPGPGYCQAMVHFSTGLTAETVAAWRACNGLPETGGR